MRRSLAFLPVFLLAALPALAERRDHDRSRDYSVREEFSRSYPISASGQVSVENVNGNLTVETWDRAEVKIDALKEATSDDYLKELDIHVSASASSVRIETEYPGDDPWNRRWNRESGRVTYTVTIPRQASLGVSLVNGGLTVTGVQGRVETELVNGDVEARGLSGRVHIETVNGDIRLACDRLDDVDRIEVESVNGRIEVSLPPGAGARVRASTVHGRLENDFGIAVKRHRYVGADMEGTIGDGGTDIDLENVNGAIRVTKS